eukprot:INCI12731.1.p1 GENE.INCI12731.1~~INCI12731.1.p1  ORF type:complete len:766 (-),score=142.09 INCI12731.1:1994-4291(-)
MRLKVLDNVSKVHQTFVPAVCWSADNQVYACSDDQTISVWKHDGEIVKEAFMTIKDKNAFITDIKWMPSVGGHPSDTFIITLTDGSFRICNKDGRVEKKIDGAHRGAAICTEWSHEANAIVTGGEDGSVKVWSRMGALRTTISKMPAPIYCIQWSPDNDFLLWGCGKKLVKKSSAESGSKQQEWKAHDGVVMDVSWNPVNNLVASCGEDCKYKVWENTGTLLYQSKPAEFVLTSIAWAPTGNMFAIGAFNMLRLADRTGWSYSMERPQSGSLQRIAWSADGTQVVGGGGNGTVVFGQLVDQHLEWNQTDVRVTEPSKVVVTDVEKQTSDELDFPTRVVCLSLEDSRLIVSTQTQCYIYEVDNYASPHVFDLRAVTTLIMQAPNYFAICNNLKGVDVYSYDGRHVSAPAFKGLRADRLDYRGLSITDDTVAIIDNTSKRAFYIFDIQGRPVGQPVVHDQDIVEVDISPYAVSEKTVAFIDINRDLYLVGASAHNRKPMKLATMVDSCEWSDASECLVALSDGNLIQYLYPRMVFVDRELVPQSTFSQPAVDLGKNPRLTGFNGPRITARKQDGSIITKNLSQYPVILYSFVKKQSWDESIRLCRFVQMNELWAALAGLAIAARHLETAEIALAAIEELDKLQYIMWIKEIPSVEGRNAELALYRGAHDEAEGILLQCRPPLMYRAIKLNIRLFRWQRALELAIENKQHIDTVLYYRKNFLIQYGKKEDNPKFLQMNEKVEVNIDDIKAARAKEKEDEKARASRSMS